MACHTAGIDSFYKSFYYINNRFCSYTVEWSVVVFSPICFVGDGWKRELLRPQQFNVFDGVLGGHLCSVQRRPIGASHRWIHNQ